VAVVAVFLLMVIGNIVSATGSGLACPDWPLCHGRAIPPLRADVLIEYSHRLTAAVTSLLLVVTSIAIFRGQLARGRRWIAGVLLVLLAVQVGLGGITVLLRLPYAISTAHLVTALMILGTLLLTAGMEEPSHRRLATPQIARLARIGIAALLVQLALGGYVRHTGAGLACPDFPLCGGAIVPSHSLGLAHWVHRWLGVALLGLFGQLALAARGTGVAAGAAGAAALAGLQVALGITAVLSGLHPIVRALHAAVGYGLWSALVWLSVRAGAWRGVLEDAPAEAERAVGAARA
jgi:heme A synthase